MTTRPVIVDDVSYDPRRRAPLVLGENDFATVTETISRLA